MTTTRKNVDGLENVVSGLGTSKSKRMSNRWVTDMLNDWQQLDAAYQTNWIARAICDNPAEDMTREWRRIKSEGAEEIESLEKELCVVDNIQEAIAWANLYGGSGILMLTGQDLTMPLNVEAIKKGDLTKLVVFDRWDLRGGSINITDILADNYLQPNFYNIRHGVQQIHHSHFVRIPGERLPRRWQEQTQGWGDSVLRKCIDDIADMVAAKDGIAELMQEANIDVITREGLIDELGADEDDAIVKRYDLFSRMKSVVNMALLDGGEKLERATLNLSGVAPILEHFITWISGCAKQPVTRLFGTSAKGMNATGEGDEGVYNDRIRSLQTKLGTSLRTLDEVLVRSALGHFPDSFDYIWNPLKQLDTLQLAQSGQLRAQTHNMYLGDGIVTKSQVMRELQAGEDYQFDDEKIEELEELENANMFEELPDPLGVEPEQPPVDQAEQNERFVDSYAAMSDAGMSHDDIMVKLT